MNIFLNDVVRDLKEKVLPIEDAERWVKNLTTRELVEWLEDRINQSDVDMVKIKRRIVIAEAQDRIDKAKKYRA